MPIQSKIKTAAVIVPPFSDFYATPHRFSTLGAKVVVQLLQKNGFQVKFFNFPFDHNTTPQSIPIPKSLYYLREHIIPGETGKCSFFSRYKLYGPPHDRCANEIATVKPDILFIACFAFCYADSAIKLSEELRNVLPKTLIIAGGAGASANPEYFLKNTSIDYVLSNEAEMSIPSFLMFLSGEITSENEVPGLNTRHSVLNSSPGKKIFTQSDQIEPAYSLIIDQFSIRINLTLSRGCPLGCTFCSNHLCQGSEYRHVSELQINHLINCICKEIGSTEKQISINFEDDNIMLDFEFWQNVIKKFKAIFPQAKIFAENGIDYRLLTYSKAKMLIDLGMAQFNFSLGSIHSSILNSMARTSDLTHYDSLLLLAKENNLTVITYFICGLTNDTKEIIAKNLAFLFKRETSIGISLFYPVPGISGFTDLSLFKQGKSILCCGSSAYPWNDYISAKTMITAFRLARIMNCCKSVPISDLEKEVIRATCTKRRLHTIIKDCGLRKIIEVPVQDVELVELVLDCIDLEKHLI